MDLDSLKYIGTIVGVVVLFILVVGFIFTAFYKIATKERAIIRTGGGKSKVVKDGGLFIFPRLHQWQPVNMNTMKLDVSRKNEEALITLDRMRVDVGVEFFVRVAQTEEAIAKAAQTLGNKTMDPQSLSVLVEGKFVDALRSVAASMSMKDLHEKRTEFVRQVQEAVTEDLSKNGLELESVSLTRFDQTDKQHFNQNNTFDAEGLTALTEQIEMRKQRRNEIERETEVGIAKRNLEAARETTRIRQETEQVTIQAQKEIQFSKAAQEAEIAKYTSEQSLISERARLDSEKLIEQAGLDKQREVSLIKIKVEREVRENELVKETGLRAAQIEQEKTVEQAKIEQQKAIEQARIVQQQVVEQAKIEQQQIVELSKQDKNIAVAERSEKEAAASARAEEARAAQVTAAQAVVTAEEVAKAERLKKIELIQAQTIADREAIALKTQAEAVLEAARKKAEAITIEAEARAKAASSEAEGLLADYKARAEGEKELNEAANIQSPEVRNMKVKLALIEALPQIIAETVKPMQNIDSIKIVDVGGLRTGNGGEVVDGSSVSQKSLPEQVVDAGLRNQVARPLISQLLNEVGVKDGNLLDFSGELTTQIAAVPQEGSSKVEHVATKNANESKKK